MSYEGFDQHLCCNGHYWTEDTFMSMYDEEKSKCPKCGELAVWGNMVNQTNGSHDEENNRIDGYIELEVKTERSGICSECGEKHICETIYEIPKSKNETKK